MKHNFHFKKVFLKPENDKKKIRSGCKTDKIKQRLQQLNKFEEHVIEHKGLLMDDYVSRVTRISHELQQA
jgi:hypothetical protein